MQRKPVPPPAPITMHNTTPACGWVMLLRFWYKTKNEKEWLALSYTFARSRAECIWKYTGGNDILEQRYARELRRGEAKCVRAVIELAEQIFDYVPDFTALFTDDD